MKNLAFLPLLLSTSCFMGLAAHAPPQPLSRQEAIDCAMGAAEQRGYRANTVEGIERDEQAWNIKLRVGGPLRGSIRVLVNRWNGSILRFDEQVKARRHRHEGDDEDEDEEHHHRRHHEGDDQDHEHEGGRHHEDDD